MPIFIEVTKFRFDGSLARLLLEAKIVESTTVDMDETAELLSMAELYGSSLPGTRYGSSSGKVRLRISGYD